MCIVLKWLLEKKQGEFIKNLLDAQFINGYNNIINLYGGTNKAYK